MADKELLLLQGLTIYAGLEQAVECHETFHRKWNERKREPFNRSEQLYKTKCYEKYVMLWAHSRVKTYESRTV